jgi:serine protease Do
VERTAELDARGQGLAQNPQELAPERPERRQQPPSQNPPGDSSQIRLGVEVRDLRQQEMNLAPGGSGVLVINVQPNSIAARAGIRPGHVITSIGETKLKSAEDLTRALSRFSKGDSTVLSFGREDDSGRVQMSTTVRF